MAELSRKWDPAERIANEDDARLWLSEFAADGTAPEFAAALGDVARALGMAQISRMTGIPREALFEVLNRHPAPEMSDLAPILDAFGVAANRHSDAAE